MTPGPPHTCRWRRSSVTPGLRLPERQLAAQFPRFPRSRLSPFCVPFQRSRSFPLSPVWPGTGGEALPALPLSSRPGLMPPEGGLAGLRGRGRRGPSGLGRRPYSGLGAPSHRPGEDSALRLHGLASPAGRLGNKELPFSAFFGGLGGYVHPAEPRFPMKLWRGLLYRQLQASPSQLPCALRATTSSSLIPPAPVLPPCSSHSHLHPPSSTLCITDCPLVSTTPAICRPPPSAFLLR